MKSFLMRAPVDISLGRMTDQTFRTKGGEGAYLSVLQPDPGLKLGVWSSWERHSDEDQAW